MYHLFVEALFDSVAVALEGCLGLVLVAEQMERRGLACSPN
jgi:hypothetical protein